MVSRFASSKDQETVIRAMKDLDEDVTLSFVGDGANLEHCKKVANDIGVENRVKFLGARSDVALLVAESYIGIQSSNWEGFGLTAVEIMACGKPVIATDVDGLKQVVEGAGLLFPVGDNKRLAEIVFKLLTDSTFYKLHSQKCVERAMQYDIINMVGSYLDVYHSIINK